MSKTGRGGGYFLCMLKEWNRRSQTLSLSAEIVFVLPVLYSLEEVSPQNSNTAMNHPQGDSCRRGVTNFYTVDLIWLLTVKGIVYHRNFFRPCKTRLLKVYLKSSYH